MELTFFIVKRYFFAKRSHNVINLISLVSVIGVAVGTFALVAVMSVYNGMDKFIENQRNILSPSLKITSTISKVFEPQNIDIERIKNIDGVASISMSLEENALLVYGSKRCVATVCGTDAIFVERSGIDGSIVEGAPVLQQGDVNCAIAGHGIAQMLDLRTHFIELLWIYVPRRGGRASALSMDDAFKSAYLRPTGVFSVDWESNSRYVFVPLALMQKLLNYGSEVGSMGIYLQKNTNESRIHREIERIVGSNYAVKNKDQQNAILYKMMQTEKWVIFFILTFVLLLASAGSVGALSMLILEKKRDIFTLQSLGMTQQRVGMVFCGHGLLVSSIGCAAGALLGLLACMGQMYFGFIKLHGSFLIDAYPVSINPSDIALIMISVTTINALMTLLPLRIIVKNMATKK
jgi:lipoprotein-releasing system permease protein